MQLELAVFPVLNDNFGYLLHDSDTGRTIAVDAPDFETIDGCLEENGWILSDILITHHHPDHTDGVLKLKAKYSAMVFGPAAEEGKIKGLDAAVAEGDTIEFDGLDFSIISVPGHTLGHIAYYCAGFDLLFCGDVLFSLGVGRMLEGEPKSMWEGLKKLRDLPDETNIFCGHEYTVSNAKFALSIDPENPALQHRAKEAQEARDEGEFTVPFMLGEDREANPFLRADEPEIAAALGMEGREPWEVFAALRKAKDIF